MIQTILSVIGAGVVALIALGLWIAFWEWVSTIFADKQKLKSDADYYRQAYYASEYERQKLYQSCETCRTNMTPGIKFNVGE